MYKLKCILLAAFLIIITSNDKSLAQSTKIYTVYFKRGGYSLDNNDKLSLNKILLACKADTSATIKLFGFSDTHGSSEYNDALSKKRVDAVFNYLKFKIDTTRIVYQMWIGESDDTYDLHLPKPHSQENCVDISVQFYAHKKGSKK